MPGFPDKFMPFLEAPAADETPAPGSGYAPLVRTLRGFTLRVAGPAPETAVNLAEAR
jgi:hydrogenase small subunit